MKKILALLLVLAMALSLVACGAKETPAATEAPAAEAPAAQAPAEEAPAAVSATDVPDEMTSADGKYQIAFVTDVGQLKDGSFNEGTYDGVKLYAHNNGKAYKYYQPANGDQATDNDRIDAMRLACENGAEVVVAAGYMQGTALATAAAEYPDVNFVFIDGWSMGMPNVAGIIFREEQAGYLAGYAVVKEGYTKLGFMGGGGGTNPACQRYGYGFAQGAEAAAKEMGTTIEMKYTWMYGSTFSPSPELQTLATGWYQTGTEIIFCCGGNMFDSVAAAASAEDCVMVGVDTDQSFKSPTVITSATKGLADATQWAIDKHYEGKWAEIGGDNLSNLGAADNAVGLPTATWSLEGWTVAEYEAMLADIVAGTIEISSEAVLHPETSDVMTVNYVE